MFLHPWQWPSPDIFRHGLNLLRANVDQTTIAGICPRGIPLTGRCVTCWTGCVKPSIRVHQSLSFERPGHLFSLCCALMKSEQSCECIAGRLQSFGKSKILSFDIILTKWWWNAHHDMGLSQICVRRNWDSTFFFVPILCWFQNRNH